MTAATLSGMTVPPWASHLEDKLAPTPLLLVQAYVDTVDQDLGTDILAHADQARAWLAEAGLRVPAPTSPGRRPRTSPRICGWPARSGRACGR